LSRREILCIFAISNPVGYSAGFVVVNLWPLFVKLVVDTEFLNRLYILDLVSGIVTTGCRCCLSTKRGCLKVKIESASFIYGGVLIKKNGYLKFYFEAANSFLRTN